MGKTLLLVSGVIAVVVLSYLLIRPFEYSVKMTAKTVPGDVIETLRLWSRSLPHAVVADVDSFKTLTQNIEWNSQKYVYRWRFNTVGDSLTKIEVEISQPGRRLLNKILIPFTDQRIEQDATELAHRFYAILKKHLSITRVKILGEAELDSSFCVCRSLTTRQIEKAKGMMKDYALLTTFVDKFKLKLNGPPLVRVQEWDHNAGYLQFDFCFPILSTDSLPDTKGFTYRQFEKMRVLKAEYHGNYITSDRAWYALIHYAWRNGHKISGFPIEYFHNNPNMGLNETRWRAEVFLPIAD